MRESVVETALRDHALVRHLLCLKFTSPGTTGVPDRILLGHHSGTGEAVILFVELKRPGKKLNDHQKIRCQQFADRGARVEVLDTADTDTIAAMLDAHFGKGICDDNIKQPGSFHDPTATDDSHSTQPLLIPNNINHGLPPRPSTPKKHPQKEDPS